MLRLFFCVFFFALIIGDGVANPQDAKLTEDEEKELDGLSDELKQFVVDKSRKCESEFSGTLLEKYKECAKKYRKKWKEKIQLVSNWLKGIWSGITHSKFGRGMLFCISLCITTLGASLSTLGEKMEEMGEKGLGRAFKQPANQKSKSNSGGGVQS